VKQKNIEFIQLTEQDDVRNGCIYVLNRNGKHLVQAKDTSGNYFNRKNGQPVRPPADRSEILIMRGEGAGDASREFFVKVIKKNLVKKS
jgi:hypothetical protein